MCHLYPKSKPSVIQKCFVFHPVTFVNHQYRLPAFCLFCLYASKAQPCSLLSHYPILIAWVFMSEYRNLLLASGCPLFSPPGPVKRAVIMMTCKSTSYQYWPFLSLFCCFLGCFHSQTSHSHESSPSYQKSPLFVIHRFFQQSNDPI